ncbi:Choline transporter-like, partial [Trinorchestia longiramus]
TMVVMALVLLGIAGGLIIISAAGDPTETSEGKIYFKRIPLIEVLCYPIYLKRMSLNEWLRLYHIFGFFWVSQFVVGCQHVVVATAVSTWYFTRNKKEIGWPILTGMQNLILYHMGSVAFGALLIALVQMIRFLLKQLQKRITPDSPLGCMLKCCQCCLACFEKFLKYITRNAYIEIAIFGCNFCKASQKAFNIITANAFRVTAINMVGDFVLLLAKIAVLIATGFIGYEIVKGQQGIKYEFVPLVVALVCVAITVHCFVSIYEMTIDTLFVCFCEDCAMNDGIQKPYFMSRSLMKFVENSKKALEQLDSVENAKKNGDPYGGVVVQPVGQYQVGASVLPSQMPTPRHQPSGMGMSPLHPAYKATSIPPSPSHFFSNSS